MLILKKIVLQTNYCSRTGCYLGDGADSLGASLSEHQSLIAVQVLGSLDEAEVDWGFVPCPEAVSVHGQDGGCLPYASAVH